MTRFSAIVLVLLAVGTAQAADKKLDRTFTVSPGGSLVVDAEGAYVKVAGADTNQVTVHMRFTGSEKELAEMTIDAAQSGNEVKATMRRKKGSSWFNWNWGDSESSIEVTVPRRYEVSVRTSGGSIDLNDTVGSVKLTTSGGSINAKNLNGTVELHTSGGTIAAEDIRGDVNARTSGGGVRLVNVDGKIEGRTSGGSVHASLVGANRGITATTSGGSVDLILPPGTTGNVSASTSGGNISTDIPVTTTFMNETRLEGTLNGGGQPIEARTSGGSIRLRPAVR